MMSLMTYKGYNISIRYSVPDDTVYGTVVGISDAIIIEIDMNAGSIKKQIQKAMDDYINLKAEVCNTTRTFSKWLEEHRESNNILPPGMDAQTAVNFLIDYLLDDFVVPYSAGTAQINTEAVHAMLQKYSKKYKKELKELDNT